MNTFESPSSYLVPAAMTLLLGLWAAAGLAAPAKGIIDEAYFRSHIARLAADEFGGRKPGTDGEKLTLAHLEKEFRQLGLKPGNGASYLQEVPMVEITAGSDASLRLDTGEKSMVLEFRKDMVIWTKRVKPAEEI
jgi:hypothetical protein